MYLGNIWLRLKSFSLYGDLAKKKVFCSFSTFFKKYLEFRNYAHHKWCYVPLMGLPNSKHLITNFAILFCETKSDAQLLGDRRVSVQIDDTVKGFSRIWSINPVEGNSWTKLAKIPLTIPLWSIQICSGSLPHFFWNCPNLYNFWSETFKWFTKMCDCELKPD